MLNTKLILVDGAFGSGKSSTANFIARHLKKNGIKVKWFYENEDNNPMRYSSYDEDQTVEENVKIYLKSYPEIWLDFVNKIKDDDTVYIIESYFFQNNLLFPLENDLPIETLKSFSKLLSDTLKPLNPVLIYFYQKDIPQTVDKTLQNRGEVWTQAVYNKFDNSLFAKNRGLQGNPAVYAFWEYYTEIVLDLFNDLDYPKLKIENSNHDWKNHQKQILEFLKVPMIEEQLCHNSFKRFCGNYAGKYYLFKIHVFNDKLCMDDYWPNMKLTPLTEDEFDIECCPVSLKFLTDENNEINSLQITKALCYYKEGEVLTKFEPIEFNKKDLELFCGDFYCESEKIGRKIYMKDNILYYRRNSESEIKLIPISQTKLTMQGIWVMLTYEFIDGNKQFTLSEHGQEDIVFTQTN